MSSSRRPSVVAANAIPPRPPQPRPRGNSSASDPQPAQLNVTRTLPSTVKLNTSALRSLPYRLTHPPPPPHASANHSSNGKAKERASWWQGWSVNFKIQPEYEVRLEDVLERKHLPPLGLKDFEEWLLFVEGTAENLYFILWLREYTARYTAWTSSLRTTRSLDMRLSSSQLSPLATSTASPLYRHHNQSQRQSHVVHPERPFASLGLAMSSISLAQPSTSQVPYPSYPTFSPPSPSTPSTPSHRVADQLPVDAEDDTQCRRAYKTQYSSTVRPPPNAELTVFYLRAKETFMTPNAEYELDVGSEVLSVFHVGVQSQPGEGTRRSKSRSRRDSGVALDAWERERNPRYGGPKGGTVGMGGVVCAASVASGMYPPDPAVFAELKEILEDRLRGSLSRLVIATYNNVGMPRAYCGSAGGCAIALVTSLPPLLASLTLGGSRWYRLLALPGLWLGLTIFVSAMYGVCMMIYVFGDLRQLRSFELARVSTKSEKQAISTKDAVKDKGAKKTTWSVVLGLGRTQNAASSSSHSQVALPFRKESILPVVNPMPLLPPPRAHTANSMVRGRPALQLNIHAEQSKENGLAVPPRAVIVSRVGDDAASIGSCDDSEESGSEDEDDAEEQHPRSHGRPPPPPIEISEAFYDEHPSPEGPATAPADWFPANLERLAAQRPLPLPRSHSRTGSPPGSPTEDRHGGDPLWPDYTSNADWLSGGSGRGSRAASRQNETALFIGPFVYDGSESSCVQFAVNKDEENALGEIDAVVQAHQPMGQFDFDALPARRMVTESVKKSLGRKKKTKEAKRRSLSPKSMISLSTNGKPERWYWAVLEWWQDKCSPNNVVDVIEKRGRECQPRTGSTGEDDSNEKRVADLEKTACAPDTPLPRKQRRDREHWRTRLRKVYLSIPAFASPLTPVLNPLIGRAQWEIVIRSAMVSFVVSCVVVGGLVGAPETHR